MKDEEFTNQLNKLMESDNTGKKKKKKWSKKRKIITGIVVVGVGFFILNALLNGGTMEMPVTTVDLTKGDVVEVLSVSGPVEGTDNVEVVSNLHSEILQIQVKEGDKVEKDQLLAILDETDARKEVDIAQNAYNLAVSTYNQMQTEAENGYAKGKQDYDTARVTYDRINALYQSGSAAQVELENARNDLNNAKRALNSFTLKDGRPVANESYEIQIENAAFTLDQKKEILENTRITSPIAGTVVRVNCKVGRFADKTDGDKPMFMIENLDVLEMKINVSEYSIGKVKLGQPVEIRADILGDTVVQGEVTAISPTGEERGSGSTERVIPITIRIIDQNTPLIAGITAKARIELERAENTWVVPISALIQQEDGSICIAVVENNIVKMVSVDTGVESDIQAEVISKEEGLLTEGMQLIETPEQWLVDGMTVAVQNQQ